ncbi:hypothetical protein [Lacrimispora sp. 38-1]|uniref:hypothetical protein n=1 Tax=Lacrimispora sp. 38-1 TaxID=3125778 RepID=UPI003CE9E0FB
MLKKHCKYKIYRGFKSRPPRYMVFITLSVDQPPRSIIYYTSPELGDVIFYTNGTRAYHTGIVIEVTSTKVKTIEGNTSGANGVIENGVGVCQKAYSLSYERIMGYGRPDWNIVTQPEYISGWNHDENGWYFVDTKTTYYKSCWQIINGHKYRFNPNGYALTGWQEIESKWYYFESRSGYDLECALYISHQEGAQRIGEF